MPKASRGRPVPLPDAMVETVPERLSCSSCSGGVLRRDSVSTALWRGESLVVIEDIPALVCQSCGERYFEDETAMALDMMRGGRRTGAPERMITVPVYSFAAPGAGQDEGGGS